MKKSREKIANFPKVAGKDVWKKYEKKFSKKNFRQNFFPKKMFFWRRPRRREAENGPPKKIFFWLVYGGGWFRNFFRLWGGGYEKNFVYGGGYEKKNSAPKALGSAAGAP